jgi:hypothetical protein
MEIRVGDVIRLKKNATAAFSWNGPFSSVG